MGEVNYSHSLPPLSPELEGSFSLFGKRDERETCFSFEGWTGTGTGTGGAFELALGGWIAWNGG